MQQEFSGHHFDSDYDATAAVDRSLEVQDADFYWERIRTLHDNWTWCANVGGDNAEE